jgi:hypothetical protein
VAGDALGAWRDDALAALQFLAAAGPALSGRDGASHLPAMLLGISEGGELLPSLAPAVAHLAGLVLLSSSGLDPWEAGTLQADRLGARQSWEQLARAANAPWPDTTVLHGRTLRYWRDLMAWPLAQPLIDSTWPLFQIWGAADEQIPPAAYARFAARALGRDAPLCSWSLPGADHGLRRADGTDGLQQVWAALETWARLGRWPCEGLMTQK